MCFRVRCRRTLGAEARQTTSAAYIFGSDAARTHQGPARRDPLERGLRAEFAALQRLDTEIRERLAHELRHGSDLRVSMRKVPGSNVHVQQRRYVAHGRY